VTRSSTVPLGVQRALRRTSRAVGRATSGVRMTPGFLIVGAQRCGTTSLYKAVTQHPAVLPAVLHKGAHYFDTGYDRGSAWYRGHFPLLSSAALVRRRTGVAPLTGESSPYYSFHPLAGERIARDLPEAKLLMLVRDPVERAYSAHAHEKARGFESEDFETALALEESRLSGEESRLRADPHYASSTHQHNAYVARGHYVDQLERLIGLVGRDRVHLVDSDDFFTRPEEVYAGVLAFLRLPDWRPPSFERHNARPRAPMSDAVRTRLEEHFAPYDERLAAWWGATPSWRR
jgi:hypothetical protein